MTGASTRLLASAPLELVSDGRARVFMRSTLLVVLLVLAAVAALRMYEGGATSVARQGRLEQTNTAQQAEIARLEAELELERATRSALDAQVAELNQRIADLDRQLAFIHAQNGRPRRAASPN